jgi:hypothetical protein
VALHAKIALGGNHALEDFRGRVAQPGACCGPRDRANHSSATGDHPDGRGRDQAADGRSALCILER